MSDGCSVPSLSGEGDIPRSGALLGLNWARLGEKVSGQHMELLTNVPERGDFQLQLRGAASVAPWIYFSQLLRCWCCALVTQHTYSIGAVSFIVEDFIHTSKMILCWIFSYLFRNLHAFWTPVCLPSGVNTLYWHRTLICVSHVDFSHRTFLFTQPQGDSASLNLSCTSPVLHSQRSSFHNLQGHFSTNHYLTFCLLWP